LQQYTAYLADLVGFRVAPARLQIHKPWHAWVPEDTVAAPDTLREPETTQDEAKVLEADRRVAASTENDAEYLTRVPHAAIVVPEPY
jgi:hypothetical protein